MTAALAAETITAIRAKLSPVLLAAATRHAAADENWAEAANAIFEAAADATWPLVQMRTYYSQAVQQFNATGEDIHAARAVALAEASVYAKMAEEQTAAQVERAGLYKLPHERVVVEPVVTDELAEKRTQRVVAVARPSAPVEPQVRTPQQRAQATEMIRNLPVGHFYLADGEMKGFYRIKTGRPGTKWANFKFMDRVSGDNFLRMNQREQVMAMQALSDFGANEAMRAYGVEIGRCGRCRRQLTDDTSRAQGIGPECIKHM